VGGSFGEDDGVQASTNLSTSIAKERLTRFGPNELPPPPKERLSRLLGRQLLEPMSLLLVAAAAVAGVGLGERVDAAVILAIVVLNALIGVVQEGRAARALEALRGMESPTARVLRDDNERVLPARELVPGDVVLLTAGDRVPADLKLVRAANLEVDESLLTGESLPVRKSEAGVADEHEPSVEGSSLAFSATLVTRGTAVGVVEATGPTTALGRIAEGLRERPPPTPLQVELRRLSARLGAISVAIAIVVFLLILVRVGVDRRGMEEAFLSAVALAVAAVPEGLATVVAVALALGVRRMASERAIVRRLPAVETLGSTTVIATDKTGTLTENRMRLEGAVILGSPQLPPGGLPPRVAEQAALVAALCSDATAEPQSGDPVEIALLELAGGREAELRRSCPRIMEAPFDSERRRMVTVHLVDDRLLLLAKGAPEAVFERCARAWGISGDVESFDRAAREDLLAATADMADRGMRVLALAVGEPPGGGGNEGAIEATGSLDAMERDLTLVCLVGLRDPIRPEARAAVAEARSAGIHIVMVTGDHPGTALAIAEEVGLALHDGIVIMGRDIATAMPKDPALVPVYARVDPGQKLALVEALRARGQVVAVTGDGVNDAPALRRADIGVAMGRSGSDVAREAADMVITDDNLATIVTAVREGRGIYDSIRKVVDYLVAGNLSEITVVVVALLSFPALGVPLLPLQLLWVNLLTDGLPALALGMDPVDPGVMTRPPRRPDERLLGIRRLRLLAPRGALIAAAALASLVVARFLWHEPWPHARALMFTVLVVAHLLYAFAARLPTRGWLTNPWLLGAVASGILLQLAIVAWPAAHDVFGTASLSLREWVLAAVAGLLPTAIMLTMERWPARS
jgi:P-type Ca2+ transporter type 2C